MGIHHHPICGGGLGCWCTPKLVVGGVMTLLELGAHCRYEGDTYPWGHAVIVGEEDGLVVIDLDHVGEATVPVGDVTVSMEPDFTDSATTSPEGA